MSVISGLTNELCDFYQQNIYTIAYRYRYCNQLFKHIFLKLRNVSI